MYYEIRSCRQRHRPSRQRGPGRQHSRGRRPDPTHEGAAEVARHEARSTARARTRMTCSSLREEERKEHWRAAKVAGHGNAVGWAQLGWPRGTLGLLSGVYGNIGLPHKSTNAWHRLCRAAKVGQARVDSPRRRGAGKVGAARFPRARAAGCRPQNESMQRFPVYDRLGMSRRCAGLPPLRSRPSSFGSPFSRVSNAV